RWLIASFRAPPVQFEFFQSLAIVRQKYIVVTISEQFAGDLFPGHFMAQLYCFEVGFPRAFSHTTEAAILHFAVAPDSIGANMKHQAPGCINPIVTNLYIPATVAADTEEARRVGRSSCTHIAVIH